MYDIDCTLIMPHATTTPLSDAIIDAIRQRPADLRYPRKAYSEELARFFECVRDAQYAQARGDHAAAATAIDAARDFRARCVDLHISKIDDFVAAVTESAIHRTEQLAEALGPVLDARLASLEKIVLAVAARVGARAA